jgi:hypothetical protein
LAAVASECFTPPAAWNLSRVVRPWVPGDSSLAVYHHLLRGHECRAVEADADSSTRIVISTVASPDRLEQLAFVAERWRGCITVAVAVCSAEEWGQVQETWTRDEVRR